MIQIEIGIAIEIETLVVVKRRSRHRGVLIAPSGPWTLFYNYIGEEPNFFKELLTCFSLSIIDALEMVDHFTNKDHKQ